MKEFEVIRQVIAEHMDIDPETITMESTIEELKIDSLDMVEIIMGIEEKLGITLDDVQGVKSIADVVEFVKKRG